MGRLAVALVCALSWPGLLHAEQKFQPKKYLPKAGVRYLAGIVHPSRASASLAKMQRELAGDGLHVVQVEVIAGRACAQPEWQAHDFVCNDGSVLTQLSVQGEDAAVYVWAWDGRLLLEGGDAKSVEAVVKKDLARAPKVMIDSRSNQVSSALLERAVNKSKKFSLASASLSAALKRSIKDERFSDYYLRVPACKKKRLRRGDLVLGLRVDKDIQLALRTLSGCRLAAVKVPFDPENLPALLLGGVVSLSRKLASPPVSPDPPPPPAPPPLAVMPDEIPTDRDGRPETTHELSKDALLRVRGAQGLVRFAGGWLGVRHTSDGNSKAGINAANFARLALKAAYGVDPGQDIFEQLETNPEVIISEKNPIPPLRPGDLLFYVSYAYLPRHVMVYLGDGYIVHAARVRGVVVEEVPRDIANYLHLVARRPLMAGP